MRIKVTFDPQDEFSLDVACNHIIQGFIYDNIDPSLARELHDVGFAYEKRRFKFFTFSRIHGEGRKLDYNREKQTIETTGRFSFIISSPLHNFIEQVASSMARKEVVCLGRNRLRINSIEVIKRPQFTDRMMIRMLSPVTVYSTLTKANGGKKTYYYHPSEPEFSTLIEQNLLKKYAVLNPDVPAEKYKKENTRPFKFEKRDLRRESNPLILRYKGFIIKGYMGTFLLEGDPDLLEIAYDAGLGAKNSQGFGCFEVLRESDEN